MEAYKFNKNVIRSNDMNINEFKCEKCSAILEYTIFNSSNGVKIFSSCDKKHLNISLLDEYIRDNLSKRPNEKLCKQCKKEKGIKICQFCNNFFCKECNINHLTVEHILKNIEKIYDNHKLDNLEEDDKYKIVKEKIAKATKYMKNIEEYYRQLENNFKKFMIDNINEIILINLLLNN